MMRREEYPAISVDEAALYLDAIPRFSKEKHTLDTLRRMLCLLGGLGGRDIIHVAGTNGKGSVCAFLSSILRESGNSTAVFTSPHLLSVKERFSFDGQDVDDGLFLSAFRTVRGSLAVFEEEGLGHPSYFEFLFLMFMVMVRERPVDRIILETGLGGRLDATNVVEKPLVSIITSISLDHMEYLGDTVAKIAGEKAGIIKAGCPVVYDNTCPEASAVIAARADGLKSPSYPVDSSSYGGLALTDGRLRMQGSVLEGGRTFELCIPFAAEYQAVNAMLAVRAAQLLGIREEAVQEGIRRAFWPGRMEQIEEDVYLDGAHNEGGIREFSRAAGKIAAAKRGGRKILLFAVVSDKEYREMAQILCREFSPDVLILTQIHCSRGLDIRELDRAAREAWSFVDQERGVKEEHEVRVIGTVEEAFYEALSEKRPKDAVFCAGSLYLIGEIKEVLRRKKNE